MYIYINYIHIIIYYIHIYIYYTYTYTPLKRARSCAREEGGTRRRKLAQGRKGTKANARRKSKENNFRRIQDRILYRDNVLLRFSVSFGTLDPCFLSTRSPVSGSAAGATGATTRRKKKSRRDRKARLSLGFPRASPTGNER